MPEPTTPPPVEVPTATLAKLFPLLAAEDRRARRNGSRLPADLAALLAAARAAEHHLAGVVPPLANTGSTPPSSKGRSSNPVTGCALRAVDVAQAAGVTRRAVVKAAAAGRLPGHLTADGWRFRPADVADWIERRNRVAKKDNTAAFIAERRKELAEVEAQIEAIDRQLNDATHQRDAAANLLEATRVRGGDPVTEWRARETWEQAEETCRKLAAELRPLAERRAQLAAIVAPVIAAERERDAAAAAERAKTVLREALSDLDQVVAKIETAREIARNNGNSAFRVPQPLQELVRQYGPRGSRRIRLEMTLRPRPVEGAR